MAAKHIETLRDDRLEEIRPSLSPKTRKGYRATTDLLIRHMGDRGLSVEQLDEAALVRFRNWRLETQARWLETERGHRAQLRPAEKVLT